MTQKIKNFSRNTKTVHNETTKSTSIILKRSQTIIPHEPESVSKFSRNVWPREGNLHSADNSGGAAWIFTLLWHRLLWYGFTICSNQINWKRASKELSGPVTFGGVRNIQVTSSHGIYQVKLSLFNGNGAVLSGVCVD